MLVIISILLVPLLLLISNYTDEPSADSGKCSILLDGNLETDIVRIYNVTSLDLFVMLFKLEDWHEWELGFFRVLNGQIPAIVGGQCRQNVPLAGQFELTGIEDSGRKMGGEVFLLFTKIGEGKGPDEFNIRFKIEPRQLIVSLGFRVDYFVENVGKEAKQIKMYSVHDSENNQQLGGGHGKREYILVSDIDVVMVVHLLIADRFETAIRLVEKIAIPMGQREFTLSSVHDESQIVKEQEDILVAKGVSVDGEEEKTVLIEVNNIEGSANVEAFLTEQAKGGSKIERSGGGGKMPIRWEM